MSYPTTFGLRSGHRRVRLPPPTPLPPPGTTSSRSAATTATSRGRATRRPVRSRARSPARSRKCGSATCSAATTSRSPSTCSKKYYEPVTKNVTSYYYEPVTEYKYSTYYDPCTGCPQKVCTPCTSYRLRSKCNSVTSYVERCAMVPVTTLKPVTYQQPVVSYYYPPQPSARRCPTVERAISHRPRPARASTSSAPTRPASCRERCRRRDRIRRNPVR